jgi:hypothetical protein
MFDEKEKDMMANVHGDPVWRCVAGLELAVSSHDNVRMCFLE